METRSALDAIVTVYNFNGILIFIWLITFRQVLSNGKYNSVLHRAVVNSNSERISIPTFYCPSPDAVIKQPESLVDEEHPSIYRSFTYAEYYEKFWDHGLNSESCLDLFKAG